MNINDLSCHTELVQFGIATKGKLYLFEITDNHYSVYQEIKLASAKRIPKIDHVTSDEASFYHLIRLMDEKNIKLSTDSEVFEIIDLLCPTIPLARNPNLDAKSILITGGIGDFIALESHMPDQTKDAIQTVYIASRAFKPIAELVVMTLPNATPVEIQANYKELTFFQKSELESLSSLPGDWDQVEDWSIYVKFPQIKEGLLSFRGTRITSQNCPQWEDYDIICPMTNTEQGTGRNFDGKDWEVVLQYLEQNDRRGVVVAGEAFECPESDRLIDVTGKTDLSESISILRHAKGYLGIDSFMSILASQWMDADNLLIKTINKHFMDNMDIYCAPKTDTNFVCRRLEVPSYLAPVPGVTE